MRVGETFQSILMVARERDTPLCALKQAPQQLERVRDALGWERCGVTHMFFECNNLHGAPLQAVPSSQLGTAASASRAVVERSGAFAKSLWKELFKELVRLNRCKHDLYLLSDEASDQNAVVLQVRPRPRRAQAKVEFHTKHHPTHLRIHTICLRIFSLFLSLKKERDARARSLSLSLSLWKSAALSLVRERRADFFSSSQIWIYIYISAGGQELVQPRGPLRQQAVARFAETRHAGEQAPLSQRPSHARSTCGVK